MHSPRNRSGQSDIRRNNLALIMESLALEHPNSRARLALQTGLTKATVSTLVADLIEFGLVREMAKAHDGQLGRPATPLEISGDRVAAIGLEVNVDSLSACLMDISGAVRQMQSFPYEAAGKEPGVVLGRLGEIANDLLAEAERSGLDVVGVAVAVPGLVDQRTGDLRSAPNLDWYDVPVAATLSKLLGAPIPIFVDNDANLGAIALQWQRDPDLPKNFAYISGTIGVGAAIVLDGALFHGSHGFGGEFGHMVVDVNGPKCSCGNQGCLETLVGQPQLRAAAGVDGQRWLEELTRRLEAGDAKALAAVSNMGTMLAAGIVSLVNLFDPSAIILGGYFADLIEWMRDPLDDALEHRTLGSSWATIDLSASTLGRSATVIGGAAWHLARVIGDPLTWVRDARLQAALSPTG